MPVNKTVAATHRASSIKTAVLFPQDSSSICPGAHAAETGWSDCSSPVILTAVTAAHAGLPMTAQHSIACVCSDQTAPQHYGITEKEEKSRGSSQQKQQHWRTAAHDKCAVAS